MQHVQLILAPQWIMTVDPKNRVLKDHALIVDRGRIIDICHTLQINERYTANQYFYLEHHVIAPGFINAHTHSPMVCMRGLADDLPLEVWLKEHIWPMEAKSITPEWVKQGLQLAMVEMIRSGTTCFNDHYFYMPEMVPLIQAAKMRACLSECVFNFATPWSATPQVGLDRALQVRDLCLQDPLLKAGIGPHSPYGTDHKIMQEVLRLSQGYQLPIHMHLHETEQEVKRYQAFHDGLSPLMHYHQMGLLGPKFMAVHMTCVTDPEIEVLAKTGTQVIHCPESNMKLASGLCPVQKLLDAGVNVALGTDGAASNNDLSMIGEMKSAALLGKIIAKTPEAISSTTALRMATLNGAKALGLDHEIGSLEVGKAFDAIALDFNTPETTPCFDPVSHLVYAASRSQVSHVWVNGKCLMEERVLKTLDLADVLKSVL